MADISIIVGYETVKQADKAFKILDKTIKTSASQYDAAFKRLTAWQDKFANEQNKAAAATNKQYLSQQLANKSARESADLFKRQADEIQKLSMKYKPLYATSKLYETKLEEINQAQRLGVLNDKQREASLEQLNMEFKNGTGAFASYGNHVGQAARRTNQLGVMMQQTGYQVGDFAVQVGSGQNVMVAFGQQATQLVGTMAMFAKTTKMIALFSGLGIAIPIISGLAAAWMRVNKAAKEAEDTQEDLKKSIEATLESLRDANDEWAEFQAGLAKGQTGFVTNMANAAEELRLAKENLENLSFKEGLVGGVLGALPFVGGMVGAEADLERVRVAQEAVNAAQEKYNEFLDESQVRSKQLAIETTSSINDRIALLRVEQEFGDESLEYRRAAFEQELESFAIAQRKAGVLEESLQPMLDLLQAEEDLKLEMEATKDFAESFARAIMNVDFSKAIAGAETLKSKMGGVWDAMKEGYEFAVRSKSVGRGRGRAAGPTAEDMASTFSGQLVAQDAWEPPKSKTSTKGGGGKSPQEQLAEFLTKKQEEADLQSQLVGLFGEERDLKSELIKFEQEYGKVASETQAAEFEATIQQIAADKERQQVLEEAKQQQEQLADYIANSMGDALMSVVDGTMTVKDAFKAMATDIIKELYRVLVVQQMVNAAKTAIGGWFADGGVISGGSQIQAYANGGVVGGPTTFPMAGGKTGLMGEAGPEAIMPLKRGANGKLGVQMEGGGGDTIVVNQSFNFQANGDATIKQLIAQAAPKIAQMTKSSLLDDRRRGGSTKAAFG